MSALFQSAGIAPKARHWQADVVQAMEESHVAAWARSGRRRLEFAAGMIRFMKSMGRTDVCVFHGRFIDDLDSFCHQLECMIPGDPLERRVDGPGGVVSLLRSRSDVPGQAAAQFRFYVWHDADELIERDAALFGRLVEAILGVAAEAEFVDDDLLLVHRLLLVGGESLRRFAADRAGPLHRWRDDGCGEPFWSVVTGVGAPVSRSVDIEALEESLASV